MTHRVPAWVGGALVGIALAKPAAAEISGGVVKLGVLTDETGVFLSLSGEGSVEAARMAVEDFNGKAAGKPIETVHADHQNKTDIGAAIARRWSDNEGIDTVVDAIALAVQQIAKESVSRSPRRGIASSWCRRPRALISRVKRVRRSACNGPGTPTPLRPVLPSRSWHRAATPGSF